MSFFSATRQNKQSLNNFNFSHSINKIEKFPQDIDPRHKTCFLPLLFRQQKKAIILYLAFGEFVVAVPQKGSGMSAIAMSNKRVR